MMSALLLRETAIAVEDGRGVPHALSGHKGAMWGRNPFFTPKEIESFQKGDEIEEEPELSAPEPVEVERVTLEVKSILISESVRVAVVSGRVVSVGDSLGPEQVLGINEEGVTIGGNGRTRFLRLTQPSISIEESGRDESTDQLMEMDN